MVGEDAAAGGAGEDVEGVAGGGELDALGGVARGDFQGGLGGRIGGGRGEVEDLGELRDVEPDRGTSRAGGGGGGLEEAGLARDRAEGDDRDGLARGEPAATMRAATSRSGGRPVRLAATRAWIRAPSPSATWGRTGPNRTFASPAASRPDDAQRTAWPQNLWW